MTQFRSMSASVSLVILIIIIWIIHAICSCLMHISRKQYMSVLGDQCDMTNQIAMNDYEETLPLSNPTNGWKLIRHRYLFDYNLPILFVRKLNCLSYEWMNAYNMRYLRDVEISALSKNIRRNVINNKIIIIIRFLRYFPIYIAYNSQSKSKTNTRT